MLAKLLSKRGKKSFSINLRWVSYLKSDYVGGASKGDMSLENVPNEKKPKKNYMYYA